MTVPITKVMQFIFKRNTLEVCVTQCHYLNRKYKRVKKHMGIGNEKQIKVTLYMTSWHEI